MKPPSIPDLVRRSGRIPALPCLPPRQFDFKTNLLPARSEKDPFWPESDKSRGSGRSPDQVMLLFLARYSSAGVR